MCAHRLLVFAALLTSCTQGAVMGELRADTQIARDMEEEAVEDIPKDTTSDAFDLSPDIPRDSPVDIASDVTPDMSPANEPLKAFPRAYGGGAEATGGRGGVLIVINTSDPSTPLTHFPATSTTPERYEGGLYDALRFDGAAYLTFDRSMNLRLALGGTARAFSGYGIPDVRDKTIFGQSAPRGGVTITGGTFRFDNVTRPAGNIIFRHLRSRPIQNKDGVASKEDDSYTWGLLLMGGEDIIVDHCSFSFAQDKGLGGAIRAPSQQMRDMTFSRNLIADSHTGAYVEINPGREGEPEKFVDRISWLGNVVIGTNRTPNLAFDGFAESVNNVAYGNNYKSTTVYHELRLNHIGNVHMRPSGSTASGFNRLFDHDDSNPRIYTAGNLWAGLLEGTPEENNQVIWKYRDAYGETAPSAFFAAEPFEAPIEHPYTPMSAADAYDSIVTGEDIGASAYLDDEGRPQRYHDPYDAGKIAMMRAVDTPGEVPWQLPMIPETQRPASYDTDKDGMADAWELRTFGDLSESYNGDHDADGYTNIEEFMNQVDRLP